VDNTGSVGLNVGTTDYVGPLLEHFIGGGPVASLLFQTSSLGAGSFHPTADGVGTLITHS